LRLEKRSQRFFGAHKNLFDSIPLEHISPHLTTCADLDELIDPVSKELDTVIDEHSLVQDPRVDEVSPGYVVMERTKLGMEVCRGMQREAQFVEPHWPHEREWADKDDRTDGESSR